MELWATRDSDSRMVILWLKKPTNHPVDGVLWNWCGSGCVATFLDNDFKASGDRLPRRERPMRGDLIWKVSR